MTAPTPSTSIDLKSVEHAVGELNTLFAKEGRGEWQTRMQAYQAMARDDNAAPADRAFADRVERDWFAQTGSSVAL